MRHHYVSFALKDHRVYKLLMVVLSISRCQPATLPVAFDYLFSARVFMEHTNNKKGPSTRGGESNFKLLSTSRMPQPRPGVCLTDNFLNIPLPEKCRRIPGIMRMKWRRHVASVPFILTDHTFYLPDNLFMADFGRCLPAVLVWAKELFFLVLSLWTKKLNIIFFTWKLMLWRGLLSSVHYYQLMVMKKKVFEKLSYFHFTKYKISTHAVPTPGK